MSGAAPVMPAELLAGRRATWIEVDLDALTGNLAALRQATGGRPAWCVVKADAYGHGAVDCARALIGAGAAGLVVALPEEAFALRRAGVEAPILLVGPMPAGGMDGLVALDVTPALSRRQDLACLQAAAAAAGRVASYHLELDTGMRRMGVAADELEPFLAEARAASHARCRAVLSHLASVSRPADAAARSQLQAFRAALGQVRAALGAELPAHLASSPALCGFSDAVFDAIRPGLLLYGVAPHADLDPPPGLRPVLSFRASVVLVRPLGRGDRVGYEGTWQPSGPTRVAIISAGYGDGLNRAAAGRAEAILGGRRVPFVGAVNMDLAQVDDGLDGAAAPGSVVTLIGRDGHEEIRIEELARRTERTAYEWLTGLGARVPRVVLTGGSPRHIYTPAGAVLE